MTLQAAKAILVQDRLDKKRPRAQWILRDIYRVISSRK